MKLTNIKINGMKNPIGFDFSNLRVSWQVSGTKEEAPAYAKATVHTKIEVAKEPSFADVLYEKQGNFKQTGEPILMELSPRTRYYVRVSVQGDGVSGTSEAAYFETSKMDEAWTGRWIKPQEGDGFHPEFHKRFFVSKKVRSARLYISGLGMYQAYINGRQEMRYWRRTTATTARRCSTRYMILQNACGRLQMEWQRMKLPFCSATAGIKASSG